MKYGSVCSGVEAATVAWHPLGWEPQWFSEIDKFPSAVLAHHYPNVPNLGDMSKFKEWNDDPIDLLVGGTPCQSFSVAGLRKGLDDPRGNLMLTYVAIAARYRPRWLVWENVPGVLSSNRGRDFGTLLTALGKIGYGFAYRICDAQYFGVAQRRRRVFVVGYLGDWRRAAAVLFERESLSGHPAPSRETREEDAAKAGVSTARMRGFGDYVEDGGASALKARDYKDATDLVAFAENQRGECREIDHTQALSSGGGKPGQGYQAVRQGMSVRRLTPRECERLQGFPDDYTNIREKCPDGPRYKALGNSMAVPVMRWIGQRIKELENEQTI